MTDLTPPDTRATAAATTSPTPRVDSGTESAPTPAANPPADAMPSDQPGAGAKAALAAERQARRDAERKAREAQERVLDLERTAARAAIAAELDLTQEQAAFLTGEDADAMREHADRLVAAFRPPADPTVETRRRPTERLRPGAVPGAGEHDGVKSVADRVMRQW